MWQRCRAVTQQKHGGRWRETNYSRTGGIYSPALLLFLSIYCSLCNLTVYSFSHSFVSFNTPNVCTHLIDFPYIIHVYRPFPTHEPLLESESREMSQLFKQMLYHRLSLAVKNETYKSAPSK